MCLLPLPPQYRLCRGAVRIEPSSVLAILVLLGIGVAILGAMGIYAGSLALLVVAYLVLAAFLVVAFICGIKAMMAASDGVVYAYPKLLLSKFGVV